MKNKNIYKMKLHEIINIEGIGSVKRVPNGWLYYTSSSITTGHIDSNSCSISVSETFVPYNEEFKDE